MKALESILQDAEDHAQVSASKQQEVNILCGQLQEQVEEVIPFFGLVGGGGGGGRRYSLLYMDRMRMRMRMREGWGGGFLLGSIQCSIFPFSFFRQMNGTLNGNSRIPFPYVGMKCGE